MKYTFKLKKNIHMYNHLIICNCGTNSFEAICEDSPEREKTIIFWPDDFEVPLGEEEAVIHDLIKWAKWQGFKYIIEKGKRCP